MRGQAILLLISTIILLMLAMSIVAQEDSTCELDSAEIITVIDSVCSNTGNNQLCYGNNEVSVATRENAPETDFTQPGDLMSVDYIQALYLSALNQVDDVWGVAQMRLVTTTSRGPQEITLLLYGDVEVENASEPTTEITIETTASINIRSIPRLTGGVIASAPRGTTLQAVGRVDDTSWIRVLVPETSAVGWLSADFVTIAEDSDDVLEDLDVMEDTDAYFGPMQAFYINTGTNLSCDNVATDGLIIQTPSGTARVTILINEVSIELVSPDGTPATAVVQANTVDGMNISVTSGVAVVGANGSSYNVGSGLSTTIGMSDDLTPVGAFEVPSLFEPDSLPSLPVLTIANNPVLNPTSITDTNGNDVTNGSSTTTSNSTTGSTSGSTSGSSSTGNNSGSTTGSSSTGDGSGSTTGSTTTGDGSGSTTGSTTTGDGSGSTTGDTTNGNANGNGNGNANGNANGSSD